MKIRFKRHFRQFRPGDIHDGYPDGFARSLVDCHVAELVEETAKKSVSAPTRNKAIRKSRNNKGVSVGQ